MCTIRFFVSNLVLHVASKTKRAKSFPFNPILFLLFFLHLTNVPIYRTDQDPMCAIYNLFLSSRLFEFTQLLDAIRWNGNFNF
jgi:hypothetical protein